MRTIIYLLAVLLFGSVQSAFATDPHNEDAHGGADPVKVSIDAMYHHLGDANEFHLFGDVSLPLPCIAYSDAGVMFTLSSVFEHGHKAHNGFVLSHGVLMKIKGDFPEGTIELDAHAAHHAVDEHGVHAEEKTEAAEAHAAVVHYQGKAYELEACKSLQHSGNSWIDLSITKNVFTMILAMLLLLFVFRKVSASYTAREKQAPKGLQSFLEPVLLFMRDEVVRPAIGAKWKKFFPYIMALFFFILFNNLLGLVPFFPGSANVTGNIGTTLVLALITFIVVNVSGTKDYWVHILWMPGVPTAVKPLLAVLEFVGIFIKPMTLLIRLFANITAGHIIILSLVSLVFIFSGLGDSAGGGAAGAAIAVPFAFALNILELLVAFLQAFVFALLSALYIGAAVEEHDHH